MNDTEQERDLEAIRAVVADSETLQNDVDGFTGLLAEDVVIVNFGGRRVRGRDKVREAMSAAVASPLAKVLTRLDVEDVRFLRPDVAVVACIKHVSDERDEPVAGLAREGRLNYTMVRDGGRWLIATAQTTPIVA
jgi:uncharacterized protein (TIGR02246 family)